MCKTITKLAYLYLMNELTFLVRDLFRRRICKFSDIVQYQSEMLKRDKLKLRKMEYLPILHYNHLIFQTIKKQKEIYSENFCGQSEQTFDEICEVFSVIYLYTYISFSARRGLCC